MIRQTLEDFKERLKAQSVGSHEHFAFRCPMCDTIQSSVDLVAAGAGANFDDVEKYLGFSCVGRWTGKEFKKDSKGKNEGCNWTLGGLFKTHKYEVETEDGEIHPLFEPATPEDAQAHKERTRP